MSAAFPPEGSPHHPHTRAVLVEPGAIEEYVLRLYRLAATFQPGQRLVAELSNDEPLVDQHNSLLPPDAFDLPVGRPVAHKIYRDATHPSRLVLPFTTGFRRETLSHPVVELKLRAISRSGVPACDWWANRV